MVNIDCLCKGCMRLLDSPGGCCPVCGYDNTQTEMRNARCLPEQTILNGRYLIGRVLGEGGFGITYLAFDLAEEHPVAIKEYFPVGLAARDMSTSLDERILVMPGEQGVHYRNGLKGFAKEGQNLAHFEKLPGIVTARDFFFANETAYLVMDYVEGQSLKQYMQWYQKNNKNGAPMDYPVALEFLKPVMSSLAEIHKAGLIHRDISPDNILVDKNGNVTLIDFGAARADVGNEFRSMTVMVKHGYAPEEQYRSHGKQGPWTDVYALCATLYHMISGILPMDAVERLYRDEMIPLKNLKLPVPVPEEISYIIEKGMAVRAENLYHSMEELCSDINRAEERQLEKEEREKLEAERKAKEEARLEAERQAEEARREAIRKEREEAERKAEKLRKEKQEQERKEREEEKRKREEALREEEEKRQQEEEKRQREEKRIEDKKREPAEGEKKCFRRYGFYGKTAVCLGLINMIWLIRSSSYDCQPFAWATGLLPIELAAFHAAAGAAALLILIFGKKGKGYGGLVFPLLIGIQGVLIGNKVFLNVFFVKFHSLYRLYWTRFCMAVILCGSFSILAALRKKRKQQKMAVCCEAAAILLVIVGIVLNFRFFGVYLKYGKGLEGYQFYYTFFLPAAVILEFAGAWSACISCLK